MKTKIYSTVYDKNQIVEYEKYDNSFIKTVEQKSYLFEYNCIVDVIDNHKITEDYLGIFSYKFPMKTGLFKKKLFKILEQNPNYDIYTFCSHRIDLKGKYLQFTEKVHPNFKKCMDIICKEFDIDYKEPKYIIYSNFFIAKTKIYKDYILFVKNIIEFMENNNELKNLLWKDFNYKSGLNNELLKQYTGLDFYTGHTFCLERCISLWIENKNYKIYEH